jgi:hypothetical protein
MIPLAGVMHPCTLCPFNWSKFGLLEEVLSIQQTNPTANNYDKNDNNDNNKMHGGRIVR